MGKIKATLYLIFWAVLVAPIQVVSSQSMPSETAPAQNMPGETEADKLWQRFQGFDDALLFGSFEFECIKTKLKLSKTPLGVSLKYKNRGEWLELSAVELSDHVVTLQGLPLFEKVQLQETPLRYGLPLRQQLNAEGERLSAERYFSAKPVDESPYQGTIDFKAAQITLQNSEALMLDIRLSKWRYKNEQGPSLERYPALQRIREEEGAITNMDTFIRSKVQDIKAGIKRNQHAQVRNRESEALQNSARILQSDLAHYKRAQREWQQYARQMKPIERGIGKYSSVSQETLDAGQHQIKRDCTLGRLRSANK